MMLDSAGLALHVDRADADLTRLRTALDRSLKDCPDPRFATLFINAPHGADPGIMAELHSLLVRQDRLAPDAEVTWHGLPLKDVSWKASGVTRRSAACSWKGYEQTEAVDVGIDDLLKGDIKQRLTGLRERGVAHLGLQSGSGFSLDMVRRFDAAASAIGYVRYEAANWAQPGHEAAWLIHARQGGPIMGVGAGMYGRWPSAAGWRWWRAARPDRWRRTVEKGRDGRGRLRLLSPRERAVERLVDGLRLSCGIDLAEIEAEAACHRAIWLDEAFLTLLLDRGDLVSVGHHLRVADLNQVDRLTELLLSHSSHSDARA